MNLPLRSPSVYQFFSTAINTLIQSLMTTTFSWLHVDESIRDALPPCAIASTACAISAHSS